MIVRLLFAVVAVLTCSPIMMANATEDTTLAPAMEPAAPLVNPSLGIGLSGVTDYGSEQPFIDVMKTARAWLGHLPGQWGGWEFEDLKAGGYLDADGWLRAMPPELETVQALILTDQPRGAVSSAGLYRLTYAGKGKIFVNSAGRTWFEKDGEIWFEAIIGPGNLVAVAIAETDPDKTGDYIRDISVVREDNIAAFEAGEVFNPRWIKTVTDMRLLRFMDWMNTNNSRIEIWADRPKPSDYSYGLTGVPLEIMIALANEVGADPWFNMPHRADDDYMRAFAQMVFDTLDPKLKAHVELSNEVWNWQFEQARWAEDGGIARWGQEHKWVQFYAMRAVEMAVIWDEVFGDQADARLVKVIATQTGWLGLEEDILNAPLWVAEAPGTNRPPASYFDAYAVTGYFSGNLGGDEKAPTVLGWIADSLAAAEEEAAGLNLTGEALSAYVLAHKFDAAMTKAVAEIRDGSSTGDPTGSLQELLTTTLPHHREVSQQAGLDLIMYEGGTHVVGVGQWVDQDELTAFFIALNYSEPMAALYETAMTTWQQLGGTVFNVFVDVAPPSKWGSWGALRHLDDDNPRYQAIVSFNARTGGWWEERAPDTFIGTAEK